MWLCVLPMTLLFVWSSNALKVYLPIYSGKPNPKPWTVSPKDPLFKKIEEQLKDVKDGVPFPEKWPQLGYRGFIILQYSAFKKPTCIFKHKELEKMLLDTGFAQKRFKKSIYDYIKKVLKSDKVLIEPESTSTNDTRDDATLTFQPGHNNIGVNPVYNLGVCGTACPTRWNSINFNDAAHRKVNNCYNYATNTRNDTFAQPGQCSGRIYDDTDDRCPDVLAAAQRDGLTNLGPHTGAAIPNPADGNCLVALVVWPHEDFHWYRRNTHDDMWSHKSGEDPASKFDEVTQLIRDPRTARRGPYTDFCTFMSCCKNAPTHVC